jgi:hypothetical protein
MRIVSETNTSSTSNNRGRGARATQAFIITGFTSSLSGERVRLGRLRSSAARGSLGLLVLQA